MPNSIKYSASAQTLALKKGNFWIGTGDVGKGPTSTTSYYNGITPPSGGYTIYLNKASGGPSIYIAANSSQLISLSNTIAGQTFATAADCLNWFSTQTDKMVTNMDYGSIITSGLQMSFDGDYTVSYSQDGTSTWYDMCSSTAYGSSYAGNPSWANNASEITICVLLEKISGTVNNYAYHPVNKWNSGYNVNASFVLYQFDNYYGNDADGYCQWYGYTSSSGWTGLTYGYGEFRLVPGQTAYLCMQYNSSTGGQMWYNGNKVNGRSGARGTLGPNTSPPSDMYVYGPVQVGPVKVRQVLFYNRELTDAEMIQNYNAISSRIVTP